jgi:hypothetical protein
MGLSGPMLPCSSGSADARFDMGSGTCSSVSLVLRSAAHQTARPGTSIATLRCETFSSPSTAADFCIGSSNNGWIVWKDKDGQTLDEVYRKQLDK